MEPGIACICSSRDAGRIQDDTHLTCGSRLLSVFGWHPAAEGVPHHVWRAHGAQRHGPGTDGHGCRVYPIDGAPTSMSNEMGRMPGVPKTLWPTASFHRHSTTHLRFARYPSHPSLPKRFACGAHACAGRQAQESGASGARRATKLTASQRVYLEGHTCATASTSRLIEVHAGRLQSYPPDMSRLRITEQGYEGERGHDESTNLLTKLSCWGSLSEGERLPKSARDSHQEGVARPSQQSEGRRSLEPHGQGA